MRNIQKSHICSKKQWQREYKSVVALSGEERRNRIRIDPRLLIGSEGAKSWLDSLNHTWWNLGWHNWQKNKKGGDDFIELEVKTRPQNLGHLQSIVHWAQPRVLRPSGYFRRWLTSSRPLSWEKECKNKMNTKTLSLGFIFLYHQKRQGRLIWDTSKCSQFYDWMCILIRLKMNINSLRERELVPSEYNA